MTPLSDSEPVTLLAIPNVSEGRDRGRSTRSRGRSTRACSMSTPTPTTTAACSRSRASPGARASGRGRRRRSPPAGSTSTDHEGSTRGSARSTSRRSSTSIRADRGAACAEALVLGDLLGDQLELPVFLYGELAQGRTRAELRRGGPRRWRSGSKPASYARTSARASCIRPPARCWWRRARRWSRSTSSSRRRRRSRTPRRSRR